MPMVIKSCGTMPRAPRRFLGASSPRYMGTTLDERPAAHRKHNKGLHWFSKKFSQQLCSPTCADADDEAGDDDDLEGLGDLAASHHNSRHDGEDVVEQQGSLPETEWMDAHQVSCKAAEVGQTLPRSQEEKLYLPMLLTSGATTREPKKPPSGYMDTESDHSRVRRLASIGLP